MILFYENAARIPDKHNIKYYTRDPYKAFKQTGTEYFIDMDKIN